MNLQTLEANLRRLKMNTIDLMNNGGGATNGQQMQELSPPIYSVHTAGIQTETNNCIAVITHNERLLSNNHGVIYTTGDW